MLIHDAEHAAKLARAIMSDISLYNSDRLAHSFDPERDLAEEIEEGRKLFQARVEPELYVVFEDALRRWSADARARATPGAPAAKEVRSAAVAEIQRELGGAEANASAQRTRMAMLLTIALIAVIGATIAFVSHERHHDAPEKHEGAHH